MGYAVQPSAWVANLLRERRRDLKFTLRDVETKAKAMGDLIPFTLVARVEKGLVDPGFRRMNLLLRIYQLPTQTAADLADLEQLGGDLPVNPEGTYEEGIEAWKSGDLRKGMAYLLALAKKDSGDRLSRQKAVLGLAVAAAGMSKYHLALHILEQLLLEPPEPTLLLNVLLQAGACWHRRGSLEMAVALFDRAEGYAKTPKEHAWICHNRAAMFVTFRDFSAAERELGRALDFYRAAKDTSNESRARGVLVRLNVERGDLESALSAARDAQSYAEKHGHGRLLIMRRIDEGGILHRMGATAAAIPILQDALGRATSAQDDVCQFHAHYHLWKAFAAQGETARANFELNSAQFHLRSLDETTSEAEEVRDSMGGMRKRRSEKVAPILAPIPSNRPGGRGKPLKRRSRR